MQTIYRVLLLLAVCFALQAQGTGTAYDCTFSSNFTAATNGTAYSNAVGLCVSWRVTYSTTGFSALSIRVETSPDNSSWTAVTNSICSASAQPPCVIDGSNPSTTIGNATFSVRAYGKYVRLAVTSVTGSGTITVKAYGYKGLSATAAGGGGGGGGTTPGGTNGQIQFNNSNSFAGSPATTDITSGNISTPGTITSGSGGTDAGVLMLGQGTAPSVQANAVSQYAGAAVTGYKFRWPAAAGTGFLLGTNTANDVVGTFVAANGSGNVLLSAGTAAIASGKTLTVNNIMTLGATDGATIAFGAGGTVAYLDLAQSFSAGIKKTFQASATTAGVNIATAGLPSSPATGDLAIDSAASNGLKFYNGSAWVAAGGGGSGCTTAGTNKQVLVDNGAGGCNSIDFPHVFEIPAANCVSGAAASGWDTTLTPACTAGTNNLGGTLPFADASTAQFGFSLPGDWDTANQPYIKIVFASGTNTTGTVIFNAATACTKEDGSVSNDASFTTADALATKTMATAGRTWSTTVQMTQVTSGNNCIPGSPMIIKITRATDTASTVVQVQRAVVTVPRLLTVQAN